MEIRVKNTVGALMLLFGLPAFAQELAATKASVVAACASCPSVDVVITPQGPSALIVIGAFALGALFGVALAKLLSAKRQQ